MKRKAILLAVVLGTLPATASTAADLGVTREYREYRTWTRIWPQSCFLMPDVAVAVDALGPYCSSPRRYRRYPWF
jgi:hypothetical protein